MNIKLIVVALGGVLLAGCVSLSGYDASSEFSCKAPDGVLCESMSGIYANAMANNLPGQRVNQHEPKPAEVSHAKGVFSKPIYSGSPIRTAPTLRRVWFSPWEDSDTDLHDQKYIYMVTDTGKWQLEHNRRRIMDAYRPVKAPATAAVPANQPVSTGGAAPIPPQAQPVQQPSQSGNSEQITPIQSPDMSQALNALKNMLTPNAQ